MEAITAEKKHSGRDERNGQILTLEPSAPELIRHPMPDHPSCAGSSLGVEFPPIRDIPQYQCSGACDVCQAKWDARTREEIDGELHPIHHRVFILRHFTQPTYTVFTSPKTGRRTLDIWPMLPIERSLCPACWAEVEAYGLAKWAEEERIVGDEPDEEFTADDVESEYDGFGLDVWCEVELRPESPIRLAMAELRAARVRKSDDRVRRMNGRLLPEDQESLKREISTGSGLVRDAKNWRAKPRRDSKHLRREM